jgi:hypothetical protein
MSLFPLQVDVTAEIIASARAKQADEENYQVCRDCVVAEAMHATAPDWTASVSSCAASLSRGDTIVNFDLPAEARGLINLFDARFDVDPVSFSLAPCDLLFEVTQEHIERAMTLREGGAYNAAEDCIVATAAKAAFPGVPVSCGFIRLNIGELSYKVDERTRERIRQFMARKDVEPFVAYAELARDDRPDILA